LLIVNSFEVDTSAERVWPALNDLPGLAMCVPYTEQITVVDWGTYDVRIALRFGLIVIRYDGELLMKHSNAETRTLTTAVSGKQTQGYGGVRGLITLKAVEVPRGTRVVVTIDAELSGLITSFGSGVIESVARRVVAEFAKRFRSALEMAQ